ncbi:uncharacterized protein LOC143357447 isoform X2 [Halictus rubicundus]|uniref:uncharacterized protein LOC143357447 isoform X2 n=1 Tax=Halictus rubicundus TaxID=77578 RepID=UPI0040366CB1
MVQTCCVKNCKERQNRNTNISFHNRYKKFIYRFPKDPKLRDKWIKAINENDSITEKFKPSVHSRVCSKHFTSDSFIGNSGSSRRNLRYNTIPCLSKVPDAPSTQEMDAVIEPCIRQMGAVILPCIQGMDAVIVPCIETENKSVSLNNESADKHNSSKSVASTDENNVTLCKIRLKKKRTAYIGDFINSDITDQKKYVHIIERTLAKKNKQIKTLQQTNRKLLKKIKNLHELLDEFRNNNVINEHASVMLSIFKNEKKLRKRK